MREIFRLDQRRLLNKPNRRSPQGQSFSRGGLYTLLKNPLYIGKIQHKDKSYEGQHQGIISTTLWEEVQEILSRNRHSQYLRSQAKEPSLLSGLLFDEHGHPFSPTHTRKKNRRYRYYVNQTKVQFKQSHPEALLRIPAQTLESVIESEIINLLSDEQQIVSAIDNFKFRASTQSALLEKASQLSERWVSMHTHQKIEFLGNILSRFILTRDSVKLIINPASLFKELLPESTFSLDNNISQSTEIIRRVSVNLKRCGVETKLIIQDGISREKQKPHADSVKAIQQSVKNALAWNQALLGGAIGSISELARKNQVSERYVNQIMKLAYLSPTIIESIIKENIPHDMTLGKLKKGIPFKWSEQEKMFLKP